MLFNSVNESQILISENLRKLRLQKGLTQEGLSKRADVSLPTLRKFEQKGVISLTSFLKLAFALNCLERIIDASSPTEGDFKSIDDVLKADNKKTRQRGWRK